MLSKKAYINLSVFNMLGQRMTTLINREMIAGDHELTWDARNIPSGIYLLKMTVDGNSETRKMIAIK